MHELGIAQSALERALEEMRKAGCSRVSRIVLRVGRFSGVDAESLRFAFEAVRAETPAAEAALQIDEIPPTVHCAPCDADFAPTSGPPFACPRCRTWSGTIVHGRELDLIRVEMT
ncbi:MAG: hydrogenase maturation nickel metallochaperone HypA [Opitutaceae bacterium]|nr:hydrogenase maturation nickel metallochaperone HypA [Opitutaceae bacterium]